MISSLERVFEHEKSPAKPLDKIISLNFYCPLDLSFSNQDLNTIDITDPKDCQKYINAVLKKNKAKVAFGGYMEKRNLYRDKSGFSKDGILRNVHLGVDFWAAAGTNVLAPVTGKVHSFQFNNTAGDYGPTIVLKHEIDGIVFHTLYGHLSLESIKNLHIGQEFEKESIIGTLGTTDINVNYAPHLHFQIIMDMQGMEGDYPGVCSEDRLDFYSKNCPDPNILLKIPL